MKCKLLSENWLVSVDTEKKNEFYYLYAGFIHSNIVTFVDRYFWGLRWDLFYSNVRDTVKSYDCISLSRSSHQDPSEEEQRTIIRFLF